MEVKRTERKSFRRNKAAEAEITNNTMIEIVVLVRDFGLGFTVFVMAVRFGELGGNVFERVQRLKQHCEQYREHQSKIRYRNPFFHCHKCRQRKKKSACFNKF